MMSRFSGGTAESLASGDAEIALMVVANGPQAPDCLGYRRLLDNHVEIDNGFGGKSRNGRASDMLDPQADSFEDGPHSARKRGEARTLHYERDHEAEERRESALNELISILAKSAVDEFVAEESRIEAEPDARRS